MSKFFSLLIAFFIFSTQVSAEEVYRIEIGREHQRYSESDLQRRVWELERAVSQLQQKVFQLETSKPQTVDTYVCTINAMGEDYIGTGGSEAVATAAAIKDCKAGRKGDGFFCKDPKCKK